MSRTEIVRKLKELYQAEECSYKGCRKHDFCAADGPITGPKEPFIGSDFDENGRPRVVILSLDPGSIEVNDNGSPRVDKCSIDRTEEVLWDFATKKRHHWWSTLQIVFSILGDKPLAEADDTEVAAAVNWMAHLNSARCSQNRKYNEQATPVLFKNCKEFVIKELEILQPQVLITQGELAWKVVKGWAKTAPKKQMVESTETYIREYEFAGITCRHVHLYHPGARGNAYEVQRRDLVMSGALKEHVLA